MTNNERVQLIALMALGLVILFVICQVQMRFHRQVRDEQRARAREAFDRKMGRA